MNGLSLKPVQCMQAPSLCPVFHRELSWGRGSGQVAADAVCAILVPQLCNPALAIGAPQNAKPN